MKHAVDLLKASLGKVGCWLKSIVGKVNSIRNPVPLRRNASRIHMSLRCWPEIMLLSSNWLPGTLPLLLGPKKLLLGIGIGVGYRLSHNGVGKGEFEYFDQSN
jgi:hypothetical protein